MTRTRIVALALFSLVLAAGVGSRAAPAAPAATVTVTISASSAASMTIGSAVVVTVANKNTGGSSLSVQDRVYLIEPDATRLLIGSTGTASVGGGGTVQLSPDAVTTSAFTSQTGSFSLEVDAVDGKGAVLGAALYLFYHPAVAGRPHLPALR